MSGFWQLLSELVNNPVFAGIAGGAGVSALLYQARALPQLVWDLLLREFTVTLVIDNADELFHRVAIYFSRSKDVRRSRWLRMVEQYDDEEQRWLWRPSFGPGRHLIRDNGTWFWLWREIQEKSEGLSLQRRETFTIRTFGRSQAAIRGLMTRAERVYERGQTLRVYVWHLGGYLMADRKPKRSLDTIFVPEEQKRRLVEDLRRWAGAREEYNDRGIPWRRGVLLEGPPGTGKTSLAFALACELDRPVYMLNLSTAGGDTGLQAAFNGAESGAVVVIEDIDSARISHQREVTEQAAVQGPEKPGEAVTLSGLLNAIDGLASRENRVLVITSNRADVLDTALLRPGRIDRREHIGLIEAREARAMCRAFLGEAGDAYFERSIATRLPMAPSDLQGELLAYEPDQPIAVAA